MHYTVNIYSCNVKFEMYDVVEPVDQWDTLSIQNLDKQPSFPRVLVRQGVEHSTGVAEVVGMNPAKDSDFLLSSH